MKFLDHLHILFSVSIPENTSIGHTVTRVEATDEDVTVKNSKIDYSIKAGNQDNKFQMVGHTGDLLLVSPVDRETTTRYQLVVQAKDRGEPPQSQVTTVVIHIEDINDNEPIFTNSEIEVELDENVERNTLVTLVSATDADSLPQVIYSITSGNDGDVFKISPELGRITVQDNLDYETQNMYRLIIHAKDRDMSHERLVNTRQRNEDHSMSASLSSYCTVIVRLNDLNEFKPQFPKMMYLESMQQNEPKNHLVFTATAHDLDGGEFGEITYQLVTENSNAGQYFGINPHNGQVRTLLDFEASVVQSSYRFTMRAMDKGENYADVEVSMTIITF